MHGDDNELINDDEYYICVWCNTVDLFERFYDGISLVFDVEV